MKKKKRKKTSEKHFSLIKRFAFTSIILCSIVFLLGQQCKSDLHEEAPDECYWTKTRNIQMLIWPLKCSIWNSFKTISEQETEQVLRQTICRANSGLNHEIQKIANYLFGKIFSKFDAFG